MILDNSSGEKWEQKYAFRSNQMDHDLADAASSSNHRAKKERRTTWNLNSPLALIVLFVLSNVQVGTAPHDAPLVLPAVSSFATLVTQHWLFCIWMGYLAFQLYDFVEKGSTLYSRNLTGGLYHCYVSYCGRSNHYSRFDDKHLQ